MLLAKIAWEAFKDIPNGWTLLVKGKIPVPESWRCRVGLHKWSGPTFDPGAMHNVQSCADCPSYRTYTTRVVTRRNGSTYVKDGEKTVHAGPLPSPAPRTLESIRQANGTSEKD